MFTPAREPRIHFPPLPCRPWQLDVALHEFPSNTALAAQPARTTIEFRTSCALSWLVFPVAQPAGSFRSLHFEPFRLARVSQTYTTTECLHFALSIFGTLLRTARLNLSTPMISRFAGVATLLFCVAFFNSFSAAAPVRSQRPQDNQSGQTKAARASEPSPASEAQPRPKIFGTVSGRVVDQNGGALAGIDVQIECDQQSPIQERQSDEDGRFGFDRISPGPFQITAMAEGFVTQTISNTLRPGEDYFVPPITMSLATVVTEVRVSPSTEEIAQEQFKEQEQQRVLDFLRVQRLDDCDFTELHRRPAVRPDLRGIRGRIFGVGKLHQKPEFNRSFFE